MAAISYASRALVDFFEVDAFDHLFLRPLNGALPLNHYLISMGGFEAIRAHVITVGDRCYYTFVRRFREGVYPVALEEKEKKTISNEITAFEKHCESVVRVPKIVICCLERKVEGKESLTITIGDTLLLPLSEHARKDTLIHEGPYKAPLVLDGTLSPFRGFVSKEEQAVRIAKTVSSVNAYVLMVLLSQLHLFFRRLPEGDKGIIQARTLGIARNILWLREGADIKFFILYTRKKAEDPLMGSGQRKVVTKAVLINDATPWASVSCSTKRIFDERSKESIEEELGLYQTLSASSAYWPSVLPPVWYHPYKSPSLWKARMLMEPGTSNMIPVLRNNTWEASQKLTACIHIVENLVELERLGFVHRDVKPGNYVHFERHGGQIRLVDYEGLARFADLKKLETRVTTTSYAAPEAVSLFNSKGFASVDPSFATYDPCKASIWSVGLILFELWLREFPFTEGAPDKILASQIAAYKAGTFATKAARLALSAVYGPLVALIDRMLSPIPLERPTARECLDCFLTVNNALKN